MASPVPMSTGSTPGSPATPAGCKNPGHDTKCPHCLLDTTQPPACVDVLYSWSISARKVVIAAVLANLTDGSTAWSVLQNEAHVVWAMESIGSTFALPIDEDLMRKATGVYKGWLMGGDQRPKPIAANPQPFLQMMLAHMVQIFQSRYLTGPQLDKHVQVASQVLDVFLQLGRERRAEVSPETWVVFLKILLREADRLLRMKTSNDGESLADMLEDKLLRVTFELFLLSDSRDQSLWDYFQEVAKRWTHRSSAIKQWNATCKGLTNRLVQVLFGKVDYSTDEVLVSIGGTTTTVDMTADNVFYTWHRMLHILHNPNAISHANNHFMAMEGLNVVIKALLNVGAPSALKRAHPSISHAPNQVTVLKVFGPWLLEAANAVRFGFEHGRASAFASLCRIMVSRGGPLVDTPTLARFYRSIFQALQSSDGLSIRSVLIHSTGIFSTDSLAGVTALVPCYVDQIYRILVTDAHLGQDVPLRRACISHLYSLICLPNHLGHVPSDPAFQRPSVMMRRDTREASAASLPAQRGGRSRSSMLRASLEFITIGAGDSSPSSAPGGKKDDSSTGKLVGDGKSGKKGFFTPAGPSPTSSGDKKDKQATVVKRERAHSNPTAESAHINAVVTPVATTVDLTPAGLAKLKVNLWEATLHGVLTEKDRGNTQLLVWSLTLFIYEDVAGAMPFVGRAMKALLQLLDFQKVAISLTVLDALQTLVPIQQSLGRESFGLFATAFGAVCNFTHHGLNKFEQERGNTDADRLMAHSLYTLCNWCLQQPEIIQDQQSLRQLLTVAQAVVALSPDYRDQSSGVKEEEGGKEAGKKGKKGDDGDGDGGSGGNGDAADSAKNRATPTRAIDAALSLLQHLVNYTSTFPQVVGGIRVSSRGAEEDLLKEVLEAAQENTGDSSTTTSAKNITEQVSPYVRNFMYGPLTILSVVEVPVKGGVPFTALVIRDETGKHIWRATPLRSVQEISEAVNPGSGSSEKDEEDVPTPAPSNRFSLAPEEPVALPVIDEDLTDANQLRRLFQASQSANASGNGLGGDIYHDLLLMQQEREVQACNDATARPENRHAVTTPPDVTFSYQDRQRAKFHLARQFLTHMGLIVPKSRKGLPVVTHLTAGSKLDRSLKMLDKTFERDCHKIGVLYVAPGQEEQTRILRNLDGSREFQRFVDSLGWKVDLTTHEGYLGGLDRRCSAGRYSQYYADFKVEVMFHVPPMMPNNPREEQQIHKKKHTGNDIVNIVWSEHSRDFQPNTITSQFNHVTIVIYPLKNQLFRISIHVKENEKIPVPVFGPLLDGMIIPRALLGALVRETAVNANRVIKETQMGYRHPFSARAKLIREIGSRYTAKLTSSEFYRGILADIH